MSGTKGDRGSDSAHRFIMNETSPKIVAALEGIGHKIPANFQADPESRLHSDLQAVLASTLFSEPASYKGTYGDRDIWMFRPMDMGLERGRQELGHADGGNYTVVVPDITRANPGVARYDHEDPGSLIQLTWGLSTFIRGLVREET